jgi:hypothetical protein
MALISEAGRGMLPMGSVCIAAVYPGERETFLDQRLEALGFLRKKNIGLV